MPTYYSKAYNFICPLPAECVPVPRDQRVLQPGRGLPRKVCRR